MVNNMPLTFNAECISIAKEAMEYIKENNRWEEGHAFRECYGDFWH